MRNIRLVADLHVHSVGSGHAYSTVLEIVTAAREKGLEMVGITDHGPAMPDGPHPYYFGNQRVWPDEIAGVRVLKGVEANIINEDGDLDLDEFYLKKLDVVLAGFHSHCFPSNDPRVCTETMLKVIDNPYVDIIVHPGNPEFPLDHEAVIKRAAEMGIPLEINNSSLCGSRRGSEQNCINIAGMIARFGCPVVIGSDAHFAWDVGKFDLALAAVKAAGIKEEQVLNTSVDRVLKHITRNKGLCGGGITG